MYDELVKQLQDYAAGTMRDDDAEIAFDAINAIEKLEHKVFILEGDREGLLAQIPRWIPVSERLPEAERKSYWVCTDTGYQCECRWTNNQFGIGELDEWGWSIFDIPQYQKVVAWMPLPKPYEPPKEET